MSREKQIDKEELQEFVVALSDCQHKYDKEVNKAIITKSPMPKENKFYAKYLMEQGYRKQSEGEWILTGTFKSTFPLPVADLHKACSVCRWIPPKYSTDYKEYNYCPNCGAHMRKEDEGK